MIYDAIIVGGGPSGIMCAIEAKKNNKNILIIEKNETLGKKILVSGNGRCNLTNLKSPTLFLNNFLHKDNKFLYSSINDFSPSSICEYFKNLGVSLKEEENNKIYPKSDKSSDILNCLLKQIDLLNIEVKLSEHVISIIKDDYFIVETNNNVYKTNKVVIATGGKSYPSLGTTGDGYDFLSKFNLIVNSPRPSLTPLVSDDNFIKDKILQGLSFENVIIKYNKVQVKSSLLFTHFGISGPGVLKLSELIVHDLLNKNSVTILVDFMDNQSSDQLYVKLKNSTKTGLINYLKQYMPLRFIKYILNECIINKEDYLISNKELLSIISKIKSFEINITGYKDFDIAFITSGGLSVKEVDPKTMMVKSINGLYVTGELLDVHGPTGGYSLTIAFSTGYKAGQNI